jgi:hypothetical protein
MREECFQFIPLVFWYPSLVTLEQQEMSLTTGCPKKMPPVIFGGITLLYLIKGSHFLQWVEKQSYYINRSIYLTKILNRSTSRDT